MRFHTDARAPKAQLIGAGAPVGVLFYDREARLQIRCHGEGRIEREGAAVDAAWSASSAFARRCYLGDAPGELSDEATSGLPAEVEGRVPEEGLLAPARANFALLLVRVDRFDWLHLAHDGHRRARFDGEGARWLAP